MPTITVNREADQLLRELLAGPEGRRNPYPLYRRLRDLEEMLRFDSPVQLIERYALADLDIGGHLVRAGETVNLLLGAANRDPDRFAAPDHLDVGRPDGNGHVSFAWGIHHCLGAPLARLEGQIVFARLRERFSRLELLDPEPPRRPTAVLRSLVSLPVRFVTA